MDTSRVHEWSPQQQAEFAARVNDDQRWSRMAAPHREFDELAFCLPRGCALTDETSYAVNDRLGWLEIIPPANPAQPISSRYEEIRHALRHWVRLCRDLYGRNHEDAAFDAARQLVAYAVESQCSLLFFPHSVEYPQAPVAQGGNQ